jgi:hypothetical protein
VRLSTAIVLEEGPPLELVEATPDSVWFVRAESVVEALCGDRTAAADRLGEALTSQPHLFPFEVGRCEEGGSLVAPARCIQLPVVRTIGVVLIVAA